MSLGTNYVRQGNLPALVDADACDSLDDLGLSYKRLRAKPLVSTPLPSIARTPAPAAAAAAHIPSIQEILEAGRRIDAMLAVDDTNCISAKDQPVPSASLFLPPIEAESEFWEVDFDVARAESLHTARMEEENRARFRTPSNPPPEATHSQPSVHTPPASAAPAPCDVPMASKLTHSNNTHAVADM